MSAWVRVTPGCHRVIAGSTLRRGRSGDYHASSFGMFDGDDPYLGERVGAELTEGFGTGRSHLVVVGLREQR